MLDESGAPFFKWFEDGTLNVSYNCLDRNVERGLGDKTAIIFEADDGKVTKVSYKQLLEQTCRLANALKARGIKKGDRVVIYMSMSVEGVVAMQACALDIGRAFALYEQSRIPRTARVVLSAREMGRLYHADGVERLVRNQLWEGRTPERFYDALEWLYGWRADTALARPRAIEPRPS